MAIFDDIGNFITKGGQDAIRKTKEVTEVARVNSQLAEAQREIDLLFCQLGKMLFKSGDQSVAVAYQGIWSSIAQYDLRLQSLNQEKMKIKNITTCSNCNSEIAMNIVFCPNCGNKVEMKVENDPNYVAAGENFETAFCIGCGHQIKKGLAFCPYCGIKNQE